MLYVSFSPELKNLSNQYLKTEYVSLDLNCIMHITLCVLSDMSQLNNKML